MHLVRSSVGTTSGNHQDLKWHNKYVCNSNIVYQSAETCPLPAIDRESGAITLYKLQVSVYLLGRQQDTTYIPLRIPRTQAALMNTCVCIPYCRTFYVFIYFTCIFLETTYTFYFTYVFLETTYFN